MPTTTIDQFLGLRLDSTGGLNIALGELSECKNCRITENYKLRKREGYLQSFDTGSGENIKGIWHGKINGSYYIVFVCNGIIYSYNTSNIAVYNNLITNGNFDDTSDWDAYNTGNTLSATSNIITSTSDGSTNYNTGVKQTTSIASDNTHIYYVHAKIKATQSGGVPYVRTRIIGSISGSIISPTQTASDDSIFYNVSCYGSGISGDIIASAYGTYSSTATNSVDIKEFILLDLTSIYGDGNEPTQNEIDTIIESNIWFETLNVDVEAFESVPSIGTLTDDNTYFFAFNDKLYIQNGYEYKYWDGINDVATVDGYIPKIAIATPPSGGGTPYDELNLLTGKKHQGFVGNGSATLYQLAETAIDSVDEVYVGGVLKTVTTDYTVNLTNGTVTFVVAPATPASGEDNVDIYWTKGTGSRSEVTGHKRSVLFGGANDSRVFMYGAGNTVIYSGLEEGLPSAEYFPANGYLSVGSDEYNVTHLSKQYDRLIIHKERDTHYCIYELDATLGANFPTYPLNDSIGNVAFGQGQNILNNPFIITNQGVFQFTATNVRDEKNVEFISERVQTGLDELTLSNAITFDFERKFEYWICVGNKAYIYNYKNNTWYYYELADIPTYFIEVDGVAYFGTSTGKIMKFNDSTLTDNGVAISARWETGFLAFDANYIRKFLNFAWIGLQPEGRSKCYISWQSDNNSSSNSYGIEYNLLDFSNINFADFSFLTNYNPQPKRLKLKIKKFTYMKLIGVNESINDDMTILNITLPVEYGGMSK